MVSVHGYNKEKKPKGFSDVYLMAIFFAAFVAGVAIAGGKTLIFLIKFVIQNWIWVLVGIGASIFVFKVLLPKVRKHEV